MTDPRATPDPATPPTPTRSPGWVFLGGLLLALGYFPSLATPFDFIDDGNLVYPAAPGTTLARHGELWWAKVRDNVEHLGPFRPALWLHWEVFANAFGGDPLLWRLSRLAWCGLAATAFLALLHALRVRPAAALLTVAAAMWNPYRNEIWTSLTLAEGVAMPYAMLSLLAARRAAHAPRPGKWDVAALLAWVVCLGCKNVFVALLPAMLALRLLTEGLTLRECWRRHRLALAVYTLPLALPAGHFVYFALNRHAGQYETPGPSLAQLGRIASWLKGAAGLDFLGLGMLLTLAAVVAGRTCADWREAATRHRATLVAAMLLLAAGVAVYLPMPMMAMRYTMPAVWGVDLALALALTALFAAPVTRLRAMATAAVVVGLGVTFFANLGRQERFAARSRFLWQALIHVERTAEPNARVEWVSGETSAGMLNAEEGIHFHWHLLHRGRGDVRIVLVDEHRRPIPRVELPPLSENPGEVAYRLSTGGEKGQAFASTYRFGRKSYRCVLEATRPAEMPLDPATLLYLKSSFERAGPELVRKRD